MGIDFTTTVNFTSGNRGMPHSISYAELIAPRDKFRYIGLCTNQRCKFRGTRDPLKDECPHCSYSLFWKKIILQSEKASSRLRDAFIKKEKEQQNEIRPT